MTIASKLVPRDHCGNFLGAQLGSKEEHPKISIVAKYVPRALDTCRRKMERTEKVVFIPFWKIPWKRTNSWICVISRNFFFLIRKFCYVITCTMFIHYVMYVVLSVFQEETINLTLDVVIFFLLLFWNYNYVYYIKLNHL